MQTGNNKHFLSNIFFLIFINLVVKPFWIFGIERTIQNNVGAADYGLYFELFNYTFLLHIILDFGINSFNSRAIAQNPALLRRYFPSILGIKSLLAVLYLILCIIGANYLNYKGLQWNLLLWMLLNQVLISFLFYFRSNLQALHFFRADRYLSILDRSLMILFCGTLLWISFQKKQAFQIEWLVYTQTVAYLLAAICSFLLVLKAFLGSPKSTQDASTITLNSSSKSLFISILKQSYPFALLGLLMSIYNRIDAVMLGYLLPEKVGNLEAGIYAAAYRLLDAVNMIPVLFATILLPMFAKMLEEKASSLKTLVDLSATLLYVGATIIAVNCCVFQEEIMALLYVKSNVYYGQIFGYLMLSFVAISITYVYGTLLTANANLWQLNGVAVSGVLLNISLNTWLIPQYGALGATWATLATQVLVALVQIIIVIRIFQLQINWFKMYKVILFFIICFGMALFFQESYSSFHFLWRIILSSFLGLLFAFIINLLEWKILVKLQK